MNADASAPTAWRLARALPATVLALILGTQAHPQGFGGLGTEAEGFAQPEVGYQFDFPADHGPHEAFRIEWWYLTANLEGPDGTPYGLQWTLFRSALAPRGGEGWDTPQLWMGHAAVTTPETHLVAERLARGGVGQAGVTANPFEAWIDDWRMAGPSFDDLRLTASATDFAFDVTLEAQGPLVFHGQDGYSVKSPGGEASHYYSQPFYEVAGALTLPSGEVAVTGSGWLDREWFSQALAESQEGWDWFALSFEGGDKLMGGVVRDEVRGDFSQATWIAADGTVETYPDSAFAAEPLGWAEVAGREVPVRWRVRLADRGLDAEVEALNEAAWMDVSVPYWEGPVTVTGSHEGRGYLEMTGYE